MESAFFDEDYKFVRIACQRLMAASIKRGTSYNSPVKWLLNFERQEFPGANSSIRFRSLCQRTGILGGRKFLYLTVDILVVFNKSKEIAGPYGAGSVIS
jgi:hypothetical protein